MVKKEKIMSIISQAKRELELTNFDPEEAEVMLEILSKFFNTWDSGGAVWVASQVLQRLIAGKPLTPIVDSDWMEVGHDWDGNLLYQNQRCSTIFKNVITNVAWDIDNPKGPKEPITFPYWPERSEVSSPVIEI